MDGPLDPSIPLIYFSNLHENLSMRLSKIFLLITIAMTIANPAYGKPDKEKPSKVLPPGLQKKVEKGGELPPGWQKKVDVGKPIVKEIYQHRKIIIPVDDKGIVTVEIGGKLIRLIEATREVVEVLK